MKPFNQNANKDMGKKQGSGCSHTANSMNSMATYTYCFYTPKLYGNFSFKNNNRTEKTSYSFTISQKKTPKHLYCPDFHNFHTDLVPKG